MTAPDQKCDEHHHPIPIVIDDKHYKAEVEDMTGSELRRFADPAIAADRDLFLELPGPADDKKIADDEPVRLRPGQRFYSAPKTINPGDDFHLPEVDTDYLKLKGFTWSLPQPGYLLFKGVDVSTDKYDKPRVDLLIRIPGGYPTAALDMFYVSPELKLRSGGVPTASEVREDHIGRNWQRFSRHMNSGLCLWRPGRDSLKTFLALILAELQGQS